MDRMWIIWPLVLVVGIIWSSFFIYKLEKELDVAGVDPERRAELNKIVEAARSIAATLAKSRPVRVGPMNEEMTWL